MTKHQSSRHGSTGPTIDARQNDGVFAAVFVVPIAVVAIIWAVQTPTAAVGVAGFVVGVRAAQSDVPSTVVGAIPTFRRGAGTETDNSPASTAKPVT